MDNKGNIVMYQAQNITCAKIAQVQMEGNRTIKRQIAYL